MTFSNIKYCKIMGNFQTDNFYHLSAHSPFVNTFYILIYNSDIFTKSKKKTIINKLTVLIWGNKKAEILG